MWITLIMGKYQREKGARFERDIANVLKQVFGPNVDCPEIWEECKVGKRPNIKAALEQAEEASSTNGSDKKCVAICKWDREPATATMRLTDFVEILKLAYGEYNGSK